MRIRVKDVLDMLAMALPNRKFSRTTPTFEPEDIRACLAYPVLH